MTTILSLLGFCIVSFIVIIISLKILSYIVYSVNYNRTINKIYTLKNTEIDEYVSKLEANKWVRHSIISHEKANIDETMKKAMIAINKAIYDGTGHKRIDFCYKTQINEYFNPIHAYIFSILKPLANNNLTHKIMPLFCNIIGEYINDYYSIVTTIDDRKAKLMFNLEYFKDSTNGGWFLEDPIEWKISFFIYFSFRDLEESSAQNILTDQGNGAPVFSDLNTQAMESTLDAKDEAVLVNTNASTNDPNYATSTF
jgi:hypothetical protein